MSQVRASAPCRPLVAARNTLGEGPVWDEVEGCLWWVDIAGAELHRLRLPDEIHDHWPMPERVAALALRQQGGLVVALASGFVRFDGASGRMEPYPGRPPLRPGQRLNDGACDAAGRFWCGAMREEGEGPDAALHVLQPDGSPVEHPASLSIINCVNWSPDGRTMYFSDTPAGIIYACDFDIGSGRMGERRIFHAGQDVPGQPDGGTVDAEGCLWSARYGGGGVARFRPDGSLDHFLPLPAQKITCCAFGGPELRTLFVTSATEGLSEEDKVAQPLAGHLMALEPGVAGRPPRRFAG
ncbi:SMP-30/gluconolactonase/LRE family protein [Roseomonas ludipueritiae]|uniref:SMP-30/gluconolactonase/LRE family protein n=1 Tax=Pseudoroseomonas ludipueritiae TaxID=198093 RepID=A0ABR7R5D0_9PROT|nr:SMP-30/gluconolactonase/LRE family protein [Pseudoroseomonas ludipueritiae]